jgi:hypothetical protein
MLAHPLADERLKEKDLFAGLIYDIEKTGNSSRDTVL